MSVYSPAGCQSSALRICWVSMARAYDSHMLHAAAVLETAATKARQLAGLGVRPGDRVAVALPPGLEFAALLHAMPLLGSVLVPVNTRDPHVAVEAEHLVDAPLAGPEADFPARGEPLPE